MDPMFVRLLIVSGAMLASMAGVVAVRRGVPYDALKRNHGFTGATYAVVGAVYGVYLAFTIVVVWQQFDQADADATSEAVHLSEVWRDVQVLPAAQRERMETRLRAYAEAVVQREWPSMAQGRGADPETGRLYEEAWQELYAARAAASGPGDAAFFNEAVVQMNATGVQRQMRLISSGASLPSIMWALLIGGSLVTVGFTYLIGASEAWMQHGVTAALTGLLVFSLLLVAALQYPFGGDVNVRPAAYESVLQSFHQRPQR